VSGTKSRCGKCHHWRGGKRKGGWKLKARDADEIVDDGIDRTQDWECCGVSIPAKKKRCGKCHGWRGGRRVPATKAGAKKSAASLSSGGGNHDANIGGYDSGDDSKRESNNGEQKEDEYTITEFI